MNILVIDDDELTLLTLRRMLENMEHEVYSSENSEEAINKLANGTAGTKINFDMIICDIMMPGISGLSMITLIRSLYLSSVPLIMMSSLTNKHILESLFKLGADDFIAKPIMQEELAVKLSKYAKTESA